MPAALQALRAASFFDFLMIKLMREAREHGKRLSEVVEIMWDHPKLAEGLSNYLLVVLRNFVQLIRRCPSD